VEANGNTTGVDKGIAVSMIGVCLQIQRNACLGGDGPVAESDRLQTSPFVTQMGVSRIPPVLPVLCPSWVPPAWAFLFNRIVLSKLQAMRCITRASIGKGVGCNSRGGGESCVL